jgi:hypothetical protein
LGLAGEGQGAAFQGPDASDPQRKRHYQHVVKLHSSEGGTIVVVGVRKLVEETEGYPRSSLGASQRRAPRVLVLTASNSQRRGISSG